MHTPSILRPPAHFAHKLIRVCVIGTGGTGSELVSQLAKACFALRELGHPGLHATVFDGDSVARPNLGRGNFYPCDVGFNKALVTVQRINLVWGFDWEAKPCHFDPAHADADGFDLLVSCLDQGQARADIGKLGRQKARPETLWLDCGNGSHEGQAILGHWLGIGGAEAYRHRALEVVANVFDLYPNLDGFVEDPVEPSCSMAAALSKQDLPVNRAVASAASELLWGLIRHGGLDHQGVYLDLRKGTRTPLPVMSVATGGRRAA